MSDVLETDPGERGAARVRATLWVEEVEGENLTWRHTADVSASGLFFDGATPRIIDTPMQLRFTLPGGRVINAKAKVVRTTWLAPRPGLAVRFVDLSAEDHAALVAFVAQTQT